MAKPAAPKIKASKHQQSIIDAFSNPMARLGFGTPSLQEGARYPLTRWSTYAYIEIQALFRSNWIVRRVCECIPQDMLKNWLTIESELDPKKIKQFDKVIDSTGTRAKILDAMTWGRLFGGAACVMIIDGHEDKLDKPLDLDDVTPCSFRGLLVFDRWSGITPNSLVGGDINRPTEFGLPKSYQISPEQGEGYQVHCSRVLRFIGADVPRWEKQAEMYWGISVLEPMIEEIRKRDNMSWAIVNLLFRANIFTIKSKVLSQMLSGVGVNQKATQQMLAIVEWQNKLMSNQGMMILDADGGLESHQYGFSGIPEIYQNVMLDICGATGYPMSRLFGRTASGLGESNEGDEGVYDDMLTQKQNRELRPEFDKLFPVIQMSTYGKLIPDFDYRFNPIRNPNDKERADLAKSLTESVIEAYNAGLISQQTATKELKQNSEVTGVFSNITDADISAASSDLPPSSADMPELELHDLNSKDAEASKLEPSAAAGKKPVAKEKAKDKPKPGAKGTKSKANDSMPEDIATGDYRAIQQVRQFAGFRIAVEYPAGMMRTLRNPEGNVVYDQRMQFDYGFIWNTVGADGDEVDVILGPNEKSEIAFVIDMLDLGSDIDQREDEHKILLGFDNYETAFEAYGTMYPLHFFGGMNELPLETFRQNLAKYYAKPDPNAAAMPIQ